MSYLQRSLAKNKESRSSQRAQQNKDFSPVAWDTYFETFEDVEVSGNSFRVYFSGFDGPSLVLLHGGGYSALTWSLFTKEIRQKIKCRVIALDIRGHGETKTDNDENLAIECLTADVISVINKICFNANVVLIGHSMGGALAVHSAEKVTNCVALIVIDVVEGTAMESLSSMQNFLRNRPKSFADIENAVQWCYRSGQTLNLESARVSMPGQIKNIITNRLAASEISNIKLALPSVKTNEFKIPTLENISVQSTSKGLKSFKPPGVDVISEESDEIPVDNVSNLYSWRINLSQTEIHWSGWFTGLSELFLTNHVPKLLLLANIHGLDTSLTVGQMQGKFQMQILPRCGHAIHEDLPDKVADLIATFLVRQKLTEPLSLYTPVFPAC